MITRNGQTYKSEIEYISSFSSALDEYSSIIKNYQKEHPANTENILEFLKKQNKDIKNIPEDDMDDVIRCYNSSIYDTAFRLRYQYVANNWKNVNKDLPEDFTWCICYTDLQNIHEKDAGSSAQHMNRESFIIDFRYIS